jgi:hypothetical protein
MAELNGTAALLLGGDAFHSANRIVRLRPTLSPLCGGVRQGVGLLQVARIAPAILALAAVFAIAETDSASAAQSNDYPTDAIVEYVYACMKANGETREVLVACSCSADIVASLLPYERYIEASTFLSMMQLQGEGADLFRNSPESRASVQDLRRAQAEGDVRCFRSSN